MSKYFGRVALGDDESLEEIGKEAKVDLDFDAVWEEAQDYMEMSGTDEAEVRIRGLDYIEVVKGEA